MDKREFWIEDDGRSKECYSVWTYPHADIDNNLIHVISFSAYQALKDELINAKSVMKRQMHSDDVCNHPFNEDMGESLARIEKVLGQGR